MLFFMTLFFKSFSDRTGEMMGHRLKIVTVKYVPYMNYIRDHDTPGTSVTLKDSLDTRIMNTLISKLNFT